MDAADTRITAAVRRHVGTVWRVLRRRGLSASDAEDATQDVFWVLAQRIDQVPPVAERSFLVSTALRVASDRQRSKWSRAVNLALEGDSLPGGIPLPDELAEKSELVQRMDHVLADFEPALRDVFILMEIEQIPQRETAAILQIPEGTVASRLRSARQQLKTALLRWMATERRRG